MFNASREKECRLAVGSEVARKVLFVPGSVRKVLKDVEALFRQH